MTEPRSAVPARAPSAPKLTVHHVAVVVRDLEKEAAFYERLLRLPRLKVWTRENGEVRAIWLDGGGVIVMLEKAERLPTEPVHKGLGLSLLAFTIAPTERETWRARLKAAGVPLRRESPYTLYFQDPEGNAVALSHYPHKSAALPPKK